MDIHLMGTELFHADRLTERHTDKQTNMTKLKVAFRNSANASKTDGTLHLLICLVRQMFLRADLLRCLPLQ